MSIDSIKVRDFWAARAKNCRDIKHESLTNLEEDRELVELKLRLERQKVLSFVELDKSMKVLDLGAGTGVWASLMSPECESIDAVEYIEDFVQAGKNKMKEDGIDNVNFIACAAQDFKSSLIYDLIFISGLFVYLNDDQAERLLENINGYSQKGSRVILRDGTSILENRYEIKDRYSPMLKADYSAVYRTADEYNSLFESAGFKTLKHENIFDEGCPLNKFAETRLRIYSFQKIR